jgi:hypothetical protein
MQIRIARIHAKQIADEKGCFVPTGPRAQFENGAMFIGGIFRQKRDADFLFEVDKLRLRVVFDDTEREECDIDPRVCLSIDSEGETVIKL